MGQGESKALLTVKLGFLPDKLAGGRILANFGFLPDKLVGAEYIPRCNSPRAVIEGYSTSSGSS